MLALAGPLRLQGGEWVVAEHRIGSGTGAVGPLDPGVRFGNAVAAVPDLDGDGIDELVVGSPSERQVGWARRSWSRTLDIGAIRILFLSADAGVRAVRSAGGSAGFGWSVATLADLDGDGFAELAVGAPFDSTVRRNQGAVWILFLRPDGTVKARQKIDEVQGGFTGALDAFGGFGWSLASPGDLDGDGLADLAVGEPWDASYYTWECTEPGAFWILLLESDGTVKTQSKFTPRDLGSGWDQSCRYLGTSMAALGDVDGDGIGDLAIGMPGTGSFGLAEPALWVVFPRADGTVKGSRRIDVDHGGFQGGSPYSDGFAWSMGACGDLDRDGIAELAVSTAYLDAPCCERGAVWVLAFRRDGRVRWQHRLTAGTGGFAGPLPDRAWFDAAAAGLGDIDADGFPELAIGAPGAGTTDPGSVWVLSLEPMRRIGR